MTFDSIILAGVADELNRLLANGRVDAVHQPVPLDLVITIRSGGANHMLLISADAQSPRIHLTSVKRPNPKTPPNFSMLLRKYLEGAHFVEAEQVDFDRMLRLTFAIPPSAISHQPSAIPSAISHQPLAITHSLIIEIMGKHSNVILVNDAGRILGAIKPVGRSKNRYREVLPGRQYVAPPSQNKVNPLSVTAEQFDSLLGDTSSDEIESRLVKTFTGVSPFAARELALRSGGDPVRLGDEFIALFQQVRAGDFLPVIITHDAGHTIGFYPIPSVQYPAANQHERTSVNAVADIYYASALPKMALEHARQEFIARLRRGLESREHAVNTMEEAIAEAGHAERWKQIGELILSQIASVPREAELVELTDYFDPHGRTVEIHLDPSLSPSENAEAYFRKYRKAVSGAEALRDRLAETRVEIKLLKKVLGSADSIASEDQIRQIEATLAAHEITFRREQAEAVKRKPEFGGYKIRKVMSADWEILVGQNSDANDYLLTRVAGANDWWVHVKASPSAHVIIRTNGKPDAVPQSVLYAAAELAVESSDSRHSSLVPVDYTLRKYVRKPKGAPSGKALYEREKTIFVTPTDR